jgi:hypothetical protein
MSVWDDLSYPAAVKPADDWDSISAPVSVKAGRGIREIPRQIGLTARYGLEAFGQTALPNMIGLPSPENANERTVADASRLLIGAGGMAKGAQFLSKAAQPIIAGIGSALGANTAGQAAGAVGAGLAGGSVREAGGGPTEQFLASLGGGIAAPFAAGAAIRGVKAGANALRSAIAPKDIQGEITVALQRAGVDWNALSREAQVQLTKDAQRAVQSGGELDPAALARLADYRTIGATPLRGNITQNPRDVTLQRNLAKTQANMDIPAGPDLAGIDNANAKTVIGALKGVETSPADAYATGQRGVESILMRDRAMQTGERALYKAAEESAGRTLPLDRAGFVKEAFDNLENSRRGPWLPAQVKEVLNTLSEGGGKFDVDTIDQLKTLLAQESRATANGNAKAAIASVRDALENVKPSAVRRATGSTMPVTGTTGARLANADRVADSVTSETLGKFDDARAAARGRREWQRSQGFIEDALDGMAPEDWAKKHILSAKVDNLTQLRTEMRNDPEFLSAARKQLLDFVWKRGKVDEGATTFTSAGMRDALDQVGDRKLKLFFDAKEIQKIRAAVNVARSMQSQPIGSAVNNSNSMAMGLGRLFSSVLNAGNKVPVLGPMVTQPLMGASVALQARSAASVPNALLRQMPPEPFPTSPLFALSLLPSSNQ